PESMRGTGEGSRPWDLKPNSTMTNATVSESVIGNDGHTLRVKYKDGQKTVRVTPETTVVTLCAGRQIQPQGRRQGDRRHEAVAGWLVRNQPRQRRPRRANPADVTFMPALVQT